MGQYFVLVDYDAKEYVNPHGIRGMSKLSEILHNDSAGVLEFLTVLTDDPSGVVTFRFSSSGADEVGWVILDEDGEQVSLGFGINATEEVWPRTVAGRWAGHRVALVGDYHSGERFPDLPKYEEIKETFTDITERVARDYGFHVGWRSGDDAKMHMRPDMMLFAPKED